MFLKNIRLKVMLLDLLNFIAEFEILQLKKGKKEIKQTKKLDSLMYTKY